MYRDTWEIVLLRARRVASPFSFANASDPSLGMVLPADSPFIIITTELWKAGTVATMLPVTMIMD